MLALWAALAGAFIASLLEDERSPVLSDRVIVAGTGAFVGLASGLLWMVVIQ